MQESRTEIVIPSQTKHIRGVSSKVLTTLRPYNLDDKLIFDIRLSIEEALVNAIKHGNKGKRDLPVDIIFKVDDDALIIEIEDRGKGFNFRHVPGPTEEENLLKTSGRGVYLIQKLMDEVTYNDTGNKVRMVKHLRRQ